MRRLLIERGRANMAPRSAKLASFKLLVLIVSSASVAAADGGGHNIHSDLNDKMPIVGRQQISKTSSQLPARTKRSFASSEELKIANESQQQAAQIIEFRSSDNQIPPANPNFEAAFQGECPKDRRRANLCDHTCLDLYDGTFECACFYGFALAVDGYSCTRRRAADTPEVTSSARPSSSLEPNRVAASETTTNIRDEGTTATGSPPYEVITQGNGGPSEPEHSDRATKGTSRAGTATEPPSALISNSSSAHGRPGHAIRKLASELARGRQVGGGAAGNRRHQSGPAASDLKDKDPPLGGGGELNSRDNGDAEPSDSGRQRARQAGERRDGGGRRARASAAERARWKPPARRHQRQDSEQFDGEMEGEDTGEDERQEVGETNGERRHSFVAPAASKQRGKDDLRGNWIGQPPLWTRAGREQDEDNSLGRQRSQQLASAGAAATWPRAGSAVDRGPADGSSKLGPSPASELRERGDDDGRPRWSFDRSAAGANSDGAQDSAQGLERGEGESETEDEQEEEEDGEREREHQALERDLGLLENLIGKTMADYRRPHWPPKLDHPEGK